MSEHTPGPWKPFKGRGGWSVDAASGGGVADIYRIDATEAAANASLIAAAPDMLALLKLALGDTEHVLSQKFWDDVRAVIGKAEGCAAPSSTMGGPK